MRGRTRLALAVRLPATAGSDHSSARRTRARPAARQHGNCMCGGDRSAVCVLLRAHAWVASPYTSSGMRRASLGKVGFRRSSLSCRSTRSSVAAAAAVAVAAAAGDAPAEPAPPERARARAASSRTRICEHEGGRCRAPRGRQRLHTRGQTSIRRGKETEVAGVARSVAHGKRGRREGGVRDEGRRTERDKEQRSRSSSSISDGRYSTRGACSAQHARRLLKHQESTAARRNE